MPELAEVEYYRRRWDDGRGDIIIDTALHSQKRIFRRVDVKQFRKLMPGSTFLRSEASGKQLLFSFSGGLWLGIHLGMTGELRMEAPDFKPLRHDHLVLFQQQRALVFNDPRLFGQIRFNVGPEPPGWWSSLPHSIISANFKRHHMDAFLARHRKRPLKAALLLQDGFPGIGNWMADEILWRAGLNPLTPAGRLNASQLQKLWRSLHYVCRGAMRHISPDHSDPPASWFFHQRWGPGGTCPIHRKGLSRQTVGGRTTAWCPICQSFPPPK
jgi:formamidopyrimidine-DNA glycosylase